MKIVNTVVINVDAGQRRWLSEHGVQVGLGLQRLQFDEGEDVWADVKRQCKDWGAMLHAEAVFDLADVESAEWLFASPVVCTGYPSPEDDFQWRDETFELGAFCRKCGIGAMQKDDFSVSGWKGWKRKKAASLNWLFDVLLVNEGLTEVFRDYDVSFRKVWNGRRSALLKDVVQVEPIHSRDLVWPKGVRELTCKYCGRGKWRMEDFLLDYAPCVQSIPFDDIVMSNQWMGSGVHARRLMFFSRRLRNDLERACSGMFEYRPVKSG
jgi:hypothetical protein